MGRGALRLVAAAGLTSLTVGERVVQAQPVLCATPKGGEGRGTPPLSVLRLFGTWTEVEGEWNGTWTPVSDRLGHYSARWSKRGERVTADLQITATDSNHVRIVRTQPQGTCTYEGTVWPQGWHVSGTYTCSMTGNQTLRWSAAIARGYTPDFNARCDAAATADPRLSAIWREQEGEWAGTWSPVQTFGDFRAGWHKGREWTNADLHMTIAGDQVTINRSQGLGLCTYTGAFTGNGWRASGTFSCSWNHNRMPWSAVIGEGRPPG
jgi:hypothetical protein